MFHLSSPFVAVLALASGLGVRAEYSASLSYDNRYDNASFPLDQVACSNLRDRDPNYSMLGSLPAFPYIGGVDTVSDWNTTECGSCYAVTYEGTTVNILAVDTAPDGSFIVSQEAMNALTNNTSEGENVDVSFYKVDPSNCGMSN